MSICSPHSGFVGAYEKQIFASQQNAQVRGQRIQQVRKQENELTKKQIQISKEEQQQQMEKALMEQKYKQYLEKKAQIEALQKAREQSLIAQQRAAKEAEEYRQSQIEQQEYKLKMQAYYEEQAQRRFQEAQEWKKQTFLETSQGKAMQIVNQKKEASLLEKQKEAQSVAIYKEQSKNRTQSTFTHEQENYEKFDKNISRRILKPEDFANTCFHNPQVVKNQDVEKENAMEKANTTMIENQTMLLEQARLQREQERIQKQRSIKALSKERQAKVLEQLEQEAKFIKKQEVIQLQKQKPPTRKPNSRINHQKLLSNEFDKMFTCTNSTIEVKDHRVKSNSPKKKKMQSQEKQRTKSVKIFTKAPLDSNLFNDKDSMQKEDYTKYAIGSDDTSQKKKVQFSDAKEQDPEFKESGVTVKVTQKLSTEEDQEVDEDHEVDEHTENNQNNLNEEQESDEDQIDDAPPSLKSNQVQDIRSYIKEQEKYLQKLEQQRINTQLKMKNEEQQLVQSFQKTRQEQFAKQVIPEESEDESSYLQSPSQLQNSDIQQQQSIYSQQQYQSSPEQLQKSAQFDENFDSHDIMQQFLKPKKTQTLTNNQKLTLIADSQSSQKQTLQSQSQQNTIQQMFSPNSDLNYSLSEVKNTKTSPIKKYDFQQMSSTQQQEESSQKKESIDSEQYSLQESLEHPESEETLGEIFQKRKAMLAKKLEQNRQEAKTVEKNGKTKEELIQIRKEMLKSKRQQQQQQQKEESDEELKPIEVEDKRSQLMKRLAMGEKVKVDKKEMLDLTNKNYEQLPEVKKKKDEQEKNESLKQRKQKVKEMDQKLRETMKQKRLH